MSDSVIVGFALAVLLFWALGAYNRLQRLRTQGVQAFTALTGLFNQSLALMSAALGQADTNPAFPGVSTEPDSDSIAWTLLLSARQQFSAALLEAQTKPMNAATLRDLSLAWARLRKWPSDPAGITLPYAFSNQWQEVSAQADLARTEFNQRISNYNEAIQQFPAFMLARLMGFKPAPPIEG